MNNLLLKNADVYTPAHEGLKDILILNGMIAAVEENIDVKLPGLEIIDAHGAMAAPGIVDHHNHFGGAGGEGGFQFRTPPAQLSTFVKAGITTAVGLLGTDGYSRSLVELLAKARALEAEGLSTWIYTGSYQIPSPTVTGSVGTDIAWIDKIIGCKMALSDHRSSHATVEQIRELVSTVRVSGMLAGKRGVVCVHMGDEESRLDPLREALKGTDIPFSQFMPTHISRTRELLAQSVDWTHDGGVADITVEEDHVETMAYLLERKADLSRYCFSSDGNGSMPVFDANKKLIGVGIGNPASILRGIGECLDAGVAKAEDLFACASSNPACYLALKKKGHIASGFDADIMLLDTDHSLQTLIAKGRVMMKDKEVLVKGTFE